MNGYLCKFPPMTRADYDALDAVNWSTLKYAVKSGLAYRHCLTEETVETDAMRLGRAAHTAVFEPDLFPAEYVVWQGGRRQGTEWERFRVENCTKTILRPEDSDTAWAIGAAVRLHPVAGPLLSKGAGEVTVTWADKDTGIACKGRLDWLSDVAMLDLKTTRDIEIKAFGRHAASLMYHCQLAFYQMGLFANGLELPTKIIAVESDAPHDVAVLDLDEDMLWAGEVKVKKALALVAQCRERRTWPGRYPDEVSFWLPSWEFPSEDEEDDAIRGEA